MYQEQTMPLDQQIEMQEDTIATMESMNRLFENEDFKKIVLDKYFEKEAINLTMSIAHPGAARKDTQNQIHTQLAGISALEHFFRRIATEGHQAAYTLKELTAQASYVESSEGTAMDNLVA